MFRILILMSLGLTAAASMCGPSMADTPPASGAIQGTIKSISADASSITLILDTTLQAHDIAVGNFQEKIRTAQPGDIIKIDVADTGNPQQITGIEQISRPISNSARLVALGIALLVLVFCAALVTGFAPQRFLIGVDNRYSNSQCQLALWFGVVATVYAATVALRVIYLGWDFVGGVGLTTNVVALTGLSALTFGGAKVIGAAKAPPATPILVAKAPNLLTDLFQNAHNVPDLGDFQMILITLAAALIFLLTTYNFLGLLALTTPVTLPDVGTTLLSGFGLGQGAYLIKKAALNAGDG
jgi:hypothetical protein